MSELSRKPYRIWNSILDTTTPNQNGHRVGPGICAYRAPPMILMYSLVRHPLAKPTDLFIFQIDLTVSLRALLVARKPNSISTRPKKQNKRSLLVLVYLTEKFRMDLASFIQRYSIIIRTPSLLSLDCAFPVFGFILRQHMVAR